MTGKRPGHTVHEAARRYGHLTTAALRAVSAALTPTASAVLSVGWVWLTSPVVAAADFDGFHSPSGNIDCGIGTLNGEAFALCEIGRHSWVAPPRPTRCEGRWGDRISMDQGHAPTFSCHSDTVRDSSAPALVYGSRSAAGPISCDSEPTGITCTDATTGHFFQMSSDGYQLQ